MSAVTRLVTFVEVDAEAPDGRRISFSARHEAVLADGRRRTLLDDRGWTEAIRGAPPGADFWTLTAAEDIEDTARAVVGPDEPPDGVSHEAAEADHWAWMAEVLQRQGVAVDAQTLAQLPHDVVLSEPLRARLAAQAADFEPG